MSGQPCRKKGDLRMYANIIIDISHESVDRVFQYRIPEALEGKIEAGVQVNIPFGAGNRLRKGYVVEVTGQAQYDASRIKEVDSLAEGSVSVQSQLIRLAWWMKERYGSTMNQALRTVLPVKQKVRRVPRRRIRCLLEEGELEAAIEEAGKKGYKARFRLLAALKERGSLSWEQDRKALKITAAVLEPLRKAGVIAVEEEEQYRNPLMEMRRLAEGAKLGQAPEKLLLSGEQIRAVQGIWGDYSRGIRGTYLIHGVTGSGKTEVYMELMARVIREGRQAIVLIPEISLTWQTVMRFYRRFGERISVLNSRMSLGERYDQYERARKGEIDIIVGPRSALFAPFERLGLIVIDEEHENSYRSELAPRYDAREAAAERARMSGASLILGSATPSLESYLRAKEGAYGLFVLKERARQEALLPQVEVVDLRRELAQGNRSIFSRRLKELIEDRLHKKEQSMLFINRRGYANFVSCRSCGEAIKCPHCDVTLTLHRNGRMLCHYCGYSAAQPKVCPSCGSPYIAPFGTGTQKIEEMAAGLFPGARILRMDLDTTSKKGGHQEILSAFARGEADILIGTQMIVKGHDFPKVSLVGAMAADLSLYASDYRCGEETFDLLTQAAGRAGRGEIPGNVVIQTYQPDHYSIQTAARQDYEAFFSQELAYRRLLGYPPAMGLLTIQMASPDPEALGLAASRVSELVREGEEAPAFIGPVNAPVYKVNDIYRKILYIKHENYDILIQIRKRAEACLREWERRAKVLAQYDIR